MEIQQRLPNGPTNPQSEEAVCALSLYWGQTDPRAPRWHRRNYRRGTALPSLVKAV
jgi:hypothetical protein